MGYVIHERNFFKRFKEYDKALIEYLLLCIKYGVKPNEKVEK